MSTRKGTQTSSAVRVQKAVQKSSEAASRRVAKKTHSAKTNDGYPKPPVPRQHQSKPGIEARLKPRPQYLAPRYRGSGKLEGMSALITGGDSGIGRAVAVLFAREGADVAIVYLTETVDARETQRAVENEGRKCILIPGDVKNPRFCRDAVRKTVKAFGKLDVLVNNAAFQEHAESIDVLSEKHFDLTMRTNIYGYFNMAKSALAVMGEGSAIVNTGSETGLIGNATLLDYSTTKGAIHAFTRSLARNVVTRGIRVNAVAPGPVWTPLNPTDKSAAQIRKFGASTDMKRPAQPEEVSPAYVFLASPACSSYITGIVLPVMGGVLGSY